MKYTTLFFLCILLHFQAKAQTLYDPIYLNYSVFPYTNIGTQGEQKAIQNVEANVGIPIIQIGKRIKWINTLYYRYSQFDFSIGNSEESQVLSNNLHDIRYSAIIRAGISDRFEILSITRVLLRSDLQANLQGNDFFPFALVLGNYAIGGNKDFTVGLGVALNSDFRYNAIIPVAALRYESTKVKLEIIYPNINLLYKQSSSLEFGLFANIDGSISRVGAHQMGNDAIRFQRNFQVLVAPTVSFRVYKQIFGHFKAGLVPISNYQLLDADYQAIEAYTRRLNPTFFLRTGISFRLKK